MVTFEQTRFVLRRENIGALSCVLRLLQRTAGWFRAPSGENQVLALPRDSDFVVSRPTPDVLVADLRKLSGRHIALDAMHLVVRVSERLDLAR
jgi:hypothetical protein